MIKSLLAVCHPGSDTNKKPYFISKESSFARLQRVWRTTQQFWQTVLADASLPKVECRLELTIESSNLDKPLAQLGNYDLVFGKTKLSVLNYDNKLITIDNLGYVAKQLGATTEELTSNQSAVEFVRQQLQNQKVPIEEPTGYGKPNTLRGKLNTPEAENSYHETIDKFNKLCIKPRQTTRSHLWKPCRGDPPASINRPPTQLGRVALYSMQQKRLNFYVP